MMKSKAAILFLAGAALVFGTAAQKDCGGKKPGDAAKNGNSATNTAANDRAKPSPAPTITEKVKTLAEGANSRIEEPFLFVVRSAETYAQLRSAVESLPPAPGIDFDRQAIVAAFAGTRNSGGFAVEITQSAERVSVAVSAPPADAIVTQALTTPFKIAVVSIAAENGLNLDASADWNKAARIYRLASGEFESSGGIAGRGEKFSANGTIAVWQFGDLATLRFSLNGTNGDKNRRLMETASGTIKNGAIDLARLDAGSFAQNPKSPVKATGTISGDNLLLSFEPLPAKSADGFQISGKLSASRVEQ